MDECQRTRHSSQLDDGVCERFAGAGGRAIARALLVATLLATTQAMVGWRPAAKAGFRTAIFASCAAGVASSERPASCTVREANNPSLEEELHASVSLASGATVQQACMDGAIITSVADDGAGEPPDSPQRLSRHWQRSGPP